MRPPLVRHSSRIKLFTRNRNRNTFHPLQPIHPSSEETENPRSKKKKDRDNFRGPSKRILRAFFEAGSTDGSSGRNFSKNRFRSNNTARENFDFRAKFGEEMVRLVILRNGGCETRSRRGGKKRRVWYWSARPKHSLSTTDFFPRRDETRREVNGLDFCIRDDRGKSRGGGGKERTLGVVSPSRDATFVRRYCRR